MQDVVRKISLDFLRKSNVHISFSNQTDANSRVFLIKLYSDGELYDVNSADSVFVNVLRPDETSATFAADITSDGYVKYVAGGWSLAVPGIAKFSVSLYDGNNSKKLTSSTFTIDIAPGLYIGTDLNQNDDDRTAFWDMMIQLAKFSRDETDRKNAENERVLNESQRQENEISRKELYDEISASEIKRVENENIRIDNELKRTIVNNALITGLDNLLLIQERYISMGG